MVGGRGVGWEGVGVSRSGGAGEGVGAGGDLLSWVDH